jgi:Arc-like DNA binding domain
MKSKDENQYKLRFPKGLRGRLEQSAQKTGLTLNAEIIRRLEQSFVREDNVKGRQQLAEQSATAVVEELKKQFVVKFEPK